MCMRTLVILALSIFAVPTEPANVAGKWNLTMELESFTGHPMILLKQDGEKLTGTYEGRYGQSELKGSIKEKEIEFTVSIVAEGSRRQGGLGGRGKGATRG